MYLKNFLVLLLFLNGLKVYSQTLSHSRVSNGVDYTNSRHQLTGQNSQYQEQSGMMVAQDMVQERETFVRLRTENYGERNNLCEGQSFSDSPAVKPAYCSATLVAPDLVVTAAHCLQTRSCEQMGFLFGVTSSDFEGDDYNFSDPMDKQEHYFECQNVLEVGEGWTKQGEGHSTENDWAIIRLNRVVPGATNLPFRRSGQLEVSDSVKAVGNPRGLAAVESFGSMKHLGADIKNKNFMTASFYTESGNSGGGVFSELDLFEGVLVETFDPAILKPFERTAARCNVWRAQKEYRDQEHSQIGSQVVPVSTFRSAMQRHMRTSRKAINKSSTLSITDYGTD